LVCVGQVLATLASFPWGSFVRSKELWAVTAAHMAHNYGLYVLLAWLPTYFSSVYHLSLANSSAMSVLPWVAAAVATNLSGWAADALINEGVMGKTAVSGRPV
jgi:MFS transporter, ACS family, solute carrier family 17 (sodium-dependent inorganic phosphate cotransporter), other